MIKLIVSDLDGTLVEDGGGVLNPEYFSVIRGLKAKGIYFLPFVFGCAKICFASEFESQKKPERMRFFISAETAPMWAAAAGSFTGRNIKRS